MAGPAAAYTTEFGTYSASTYTPIDFITDVDGFDLNTDALKTTHLASSQHTQTYVPGFKDPGPVTVTGWFDEASTTQKALFDSWVNGDTDKVYYVKYKTSGLIIKGSAFVTNINLHGATEDLLEFKATVQFSGPLTISFPT